MSTNLELEQEADELCASLFTQPDISHLGECPICCLPLSIDERKSTMMSCCTKIICDGCDYANKKREIEQRLEPRCAFCRNPAPKSEEEYDKNVMERIKENDPVAMVQMGKKIKNEDFGKAVEYWTKAAELGDVDACCGVGILYYNGKGVEKDAKKAINHWEQAAIGGHPNARVLLANYEMDNGRFDRAAQHFIIAANLGDNFSLKCVKQAFIEGIVSKEEYTAARRGYQAAVDATKSAEREEAEEARKSGLVRSLF
jgi:tetratricopeptide (TPR) repeat protein